MARTGWSSVNYLRSSATPLVAAAPLTLACWYWANSTGTTQYVFGLFNSSSGDSRNQFAILQNSGGTIQGKTSSSSSSAGASSSASVATSAWNHCCFVTAAADNRTIYLNGGNIGTNATSLTPSGLNRTSVGLQDNSAGSKLPVDSAARVAHAAMWNVALSATDTAALAAGVHPLVIRSDTLVGYWPITGQFNPEIGYVGGQDLTINGSLSTADEPPVFWPAIFRRGGFHSLPVASVSLSGVAMTGTTGTLARTALVTATGVAGTGQTNTFATLALKTLTGVVGTGVIAAITPQVLFALLGVQGASSIGALVADTAQRIALAGVQGAGGIGAMKAALKLLLASNGIVGNAGETAEAVALALNGLAAEAGIGDPTVADNWRRLATAPADWASETGGATAWMPISGGATDWTDV
jgi:hypothetical protein